MVQIIVPFTDRSSKGKLNYPSIQIVFHLKDLPLALLIQQNLGYGAKWFGKSLTCLELSNSGDTLKLLIPNHSRKTISGQNN